MRYRRSTENPRANEDCEGEVAMELADLVRLGLPRFGYLIPEASLRDGELLTNKDLDIAVALLSERRSDGFLQIGQPISCENSDRLESLGAHCFLSLRPATAGMDLVKNRQNDSPLSGLCTAE